MILQTPLDILEEDIPLNLEINKTYLINGKTYQLNKLIQQNVISKSVNDNQINSEDIIKINDIYILELIL